MRTLGATLVVITSLAVAWPVSTWADCGDDCSSSCEDDDAARWARCTEACIKRCLKDDPPPVPEPSPPAPVK